MDYEERLGSGFSSISTAISSAAAAVSIPPATPGDGGISTHIDNIYQLAVKPDGTVDLISLFKDSIKRRAIYNALGLTPITAETEFIPATYERNQIQKRTSWNEQPGMSDAVNQLPDRFKPKSELDLVRIFTTYYSGSFNFIDERWIADKISIAPKSDPSSYWKTLNATEDPSDYLKLLSRWVLYGVRLNPLAMIETDPDSVGALVVGYPVIKPQGYTAVSTYSLYDTDVVNYGTAVNGFLQRLYAKFSNNTMTVLNVSQWSDLAQISNVYKSMIGEMMMFIQFVATVVPITATFRVPTDMVPEGAGGSGDVYSKRNQNEIAQGNNATVTTYSYIPQLSEGSKDLGDYASPPAPWVPVFTDGLKMSPVDSLIYQYLKAVLLLKNQEVKLAGALSKALDPKSDYGTVPTAAQADPLQNPFLTYDPTASMKAGYPVFVNTAANLSTQYMTQRFGKAVTVKDKNLPTVKDYANMPVLRSFYGKSINVPGGGTMSPAEIQALSAGQKKKIPALAWIAGAVAAAAIYYQYKG
jgi:hypothetical protein